MHPKIEPKATYRGAVRLLSQNRSVFVSIDPIDNPVAEDREGYIVQCECDGEVRVSANLAGDTIEAIYSAYKEARKERRRTRFLWRVTYAITDILDYEGKGQ